MSHIYANSTVHPGQWLARCVHKRSHDVHGIGTLVLVPQSALLPHTLLGMPLVTQRTEQPLVSMLCLLVCLPLLLLLVPLLGFLGGLLGPPCTLLCLLGKLGLLLLRSPCCGSGMERTIRAQ